MKHLLAFVAALGLLVAPFALADAQVTVTSSPVVSSQQTCTTSAAQLPAAGYQNGVVIQSLTTNTGTVYVGGPNVTTSTGYPLVPGQAISYAAANSANIYIVCTNTTDVVAVTGS